MEIKQLRYFLTVAQLGSFSRASEVLRVAQPALSRQIQQLERTNRVQLLIRQPRGVALTAAGERLLEHAQLILQQVEEARDDLLLHNRAVERQLTIGVPIAVSSVLSAHLEAGVVGRFPGLRLKIVEGFSALLHEWLISGSVDFAILYAVPNSMIRHIPLVEEDLYLVSRSDAELGEGEFMPGSELSKVSLILPHRPHPTWELLERLGITCAEHVPVDTIKGMLQAVRQGRGHALLSLAAVGEQAISDLKVTPIRFPRPTRVISLCRARVRHYPRQIDNVFDFIATEVRDFAAAGLWPGGVPIR